MGPPPRPPRPPVKRRKARTPRPTRKGCQGASSGRAGGRRRARGAPEISTFFSRAMAVPMVEAASVRAAG
jgi:hypothetical protein